MVANTRYQAEAEGQDVLESQWNLAGQPYSSKPHHRRTFCPFAYSMLSTYICFLLVPQGYLACIGKACISGTHVDVVRFL